MAKEEQIKTSIDLTGEKEYRAACTNINSSLREIGSEMKLTTAEFADNADSVEALTAKQKLLQKQFDEQAKKAEAAEKALKKMRDNGIEPTNPAYQKMQTNLNNTKADMVKMCIRDRTYTARELSFGNAITFTANRLQYASNQTKLNISTQLFDRGLLNRNGVMDVWNMAHVEGGEKYYIRKEYAEVSELGKEVTPNAKKDGSGVPNNDPAAIDPDGGGEAN